MYYLTDASHLLFVEREREGGKGRIKERMQREIHLEDSDFILAVLDLLTQTYWILYLKESTSSFNPSSKHFPILCLKLKVIKKATQIINSISSLILFNT